MIGVGLVIALLVSREWILCAIEIGSGLKSAGGRIYWHRKALVTSPCALGWLGQRRDLCLVSAFLP